MKFLSNNRYLVIALLVGIIGGAMLDLQSSNIDYLAIVADPKLLAIAAALLLLFSQYNRSNMTHMRAYIVTLEGQVNTLEKSLVEAKSLIDKMGVKLEYMEKLVQRECPYFESDPATGACLHCDRRLAYGRSPAPPDRS